MGLSQETGRQPRTVQR